MMNERVTYLPATEKPLLALRLTVPMEDGRQLQMEVCVDRDDQGDNLDVVLDKITRACNRVKAKNALPEIRSQLRQCRDKIGRLRDQLGECDERFERQIREAQQSLIEQRDARIEEETSKWDRRGEFRLQGNAKAAVEGLQRSLKELAEGRDPIFGRWKEEQSQKKGLLDNAIEGEQALLRQLDAYERMARGEDISDFAG